MNSDVSGVLVMLLLLTATLAYGLLRFKWKFVWLYAYVAILWIINFYLFAVGLGSRDLMLVLYPLCFPVLVALPTCLEQYSNALFQNKGDSVVKYVLYLMPVYSAVCTYGIMADSALYEKNLAHLFAGEFIKINHIIGTMTGALTLGTIFSLLHAVYLIRTGRSARFSGPSYIYLGLPWLQIILMGGGLLAIVVNALGLKSAQFSFFVISSVSVALGVYVVLISRYEERKLTSIISNAMFFAPSMNKVIEGFLLDPDVKVLSVLFQEFTKQNLAEISLISCSDWDTFFTEQRFSWPEFKNRVRIRYALQELNSGYLATKTVESLSIELGFKSRKSFYTAFEAVAGKSFRGEVYR